MKIPHDSPAELKEIADEHMNFNTTGLSIIIWNCCDNVMPSCNSTSVLLYRLCCHYVRNLNEIQ